MKRDESPAKQACNTRNKDTDSTRVYASFFNPWNEAKRCETRTSHMYMTRSLHHESEQEPTKKTRICVCTPPSLSYEREQQSWKRGPYYNTHSHSTWKLKSWRWVKGGRSLSLQCKLGTAEVLKTDRMRSFHVCTFFFSNNHDKP